MGSISSGIRGHVNSVARPLDRPRRRSNCLVDSGSLAAAAFVKVAL